MDHLGDVHELDFGAALIAVGGIPLPAVNQHHAVARASLCEAGGESIFFSSRAQQARDYVRNQHDSPTARSGVSLAHI